jgi:hypothetical protein
MALGPFRNARERGAFPPPASTKSSVKRKRRTGTAALEASEVARAAKVWKSRIHAAKRGVTVATVVCRSMNSETRTA